MENLKAVLFATIVLFVTVFVTTDSFGQKKKKGLLGDIQDIVNDVKKTTREINNTTNEVNKTVKSVKALKKSWVKDTASNIKYKQIPDYRNRDEVVIAKKQKLSIENGEFVNLSWSPVAKFDNQLFPSFIVAWATYKGDKNEDMGSSLGFSIKTNLPNVVLKWEIESKDKSLFDIDSGYISCNELRNSQNFMPKISWNFKNLSRHETNAPVSISFRLTDPNTGRKVEKLVNVSLRSINDCLLAYNQKDYRSMFVAYINEDHPEIDKILKEALDTKMINSIDGYQPFGFDPPSDKKKFVEMYNEAKKEVDLQVAAIWRVLHNRGFKYSSITDNSGDNNQSIISQTVRTFDSAMKTKQANCVDGTVVLASILKRIGLTTYLVLVPGHCFLAYKDDGKSDNLTYLETTMMSHDSYMSKSEVAKYRKTLINTSYPKSSLRKASDKDLQYFLQFYAAQFHGRKAFEKYEKEAILIDVNENRKYVLPIPTYN